MGLWVIAAVGTVVMLGTLVAEPVLQPTLLAGAAVLGATVVAASLLARVLRQRPRQWDLIGVAGAWFAATTLALAVQGPPVAWRPMLTLAPLALAVAALWWLDDQAPRRAAVGGMAPALAAGAVLVGNVRAIVWEPSRRRRCRRGRSTWRRWAPRRTSNRCWRGTGGARQLAARRRGGPQQTRGDGCGAHRGAVWRAWTFAVQAVVPAGVAVWREDRRPLRWVATLLVSAASSTLLADAGVDLVEAHTMPPALVVLALSASAVRSGRTTSSWPGLGTGAGLLVLPTLLQLADDPAYLARLAVNLLLGLLLAAAGRVWALQAPLVIGVGAALVFAAATQYEVVTDVVPRWVLLASGGVMMLWLPIGYERQRLRLSAARWHVAAMR